MKCKVYVGQGMVEELDSFGDEWNMANLLASAAFKGRWEENLTNNKACHGIFGSKTEICWLCNKENCSFVAGFSFSAC